MAMVYLKKHNENIYNVEDYPLPPHSAPQQSSESPTPAGKQERPYTQGMYISKFRSMVKSEEQMRKSAHRTMGYAETPLSTPCNFLKKNQGIRWKSSADHTCVKNTVPPVPLHNEALKSIPAHPQKNAKAENVQNVKTPPKRARPRYADTRNGTVHDLASSGLLPQYIFSPKYGKVPNYILARKKSGKANESAQDNTHQDMGAGAVGPSGVKYISQEERRSLLAGLKTNWEKLQNRYQGLSVLTDTESKKIVKTGLEKELKQLEEDIMLLENNPHIYVCDQQ